MKREHRVVMLAILFGLIAWVLNGVVDFFVFASSPSLPAGVSLPILHVLLSVGLLATFLILALFVSRVITTQGRTEGVLLDSEERFRREARRAEVLVRTAARLSAQHDAEAVLNAVCEETARALSVHLATVYLYDEGRDALCPAGGVGMAAEYRERLDPIPRALYEEVGRQTGSLVVFPDLKAIGWPHDALQAETGARTLTFATMSHEGQLIGALGIVSLGEVRQLSDDERALLQGLADQGALAIVNARLFAEHKRAEEALQRHSDQLEVLRQVGLELAAQLDLDSLLRSIVSRAIKLIGATDGGLYLYRPEQGALERVVSVGSTIPIGSILRRGEGLSGKVWETGQPLIVDDYQQWPGRAVIFKDERNAAVVGVPVRWGEEFLGVLNVAAGPSHAFSPADAELLTLFATQAAIAIRNARALAAVEEQRRRAEALAQATAALTSTLKLEPLLENVVAAAIQAIPAAEKGSVQLREEGSDELSVRAVVGYSDKRIRKIRFMAEGGYSARAAQEGRPLLIADARDQSIRYNGDVAEVRAVQSAIAAPLRYHDRIIGVICLDNVSRKSAFTEEDLYRLAIFANQAAVAVENARLFEAERRRIAELEALRQASLRLTSRLELPAVLEAILEHALELVAADDAHIFLYDGQVLTFGAALGADGRRQQPPNMPRPQGLTYTVARSGQQIVVPDARHHSLYQDRPWDGAVVGMPLGIGRRVLGVMNVIMSKPHQFNENELRLLGLLADQAAIAIENARLYGDLQQQMEQLKTAQVQLVQSARMAAVGELAAGVAHELNNPLTTILGFVELLLEEQGADAPARRDLEAIAASARRARDIVYNLLSFARQGTLWKQQTDINLLLQRTLSLLRIQLEKNGIVIEEDYADDLGLLAVDMGQIEQVFLNLIKNAGQAMPDGGELRLYTARVGQEVAIAISDTGGGIPPEVREHLFEPFVTTKASGGGLGLSVSLGIVQEHGGRITVENQGQGTTFTVWLPVEQADGKDTR